MRHGVAYMKQEEAAYAEQVRARLEKQLQRRAKELGFEVKKIEPAETARRRNNHRPRSPRSPQRSILRKKSKRRERPASVVRAASTHHPVAASPVN